MRRPNPPPFSSSFFSSLQGTLLLQPSCLPFIISSLFLPCFWVLSTFLRGSIRIPNSLMSSLVPPLAIATDGGSAGTSGEGVPPCSVEAVSCLGPTVLSDGLGWVEEDVLHIRSSFKTVESLQELKRFVLDSEGLDRVCCLLCSTEDLVCHSAPTGSTPLFFFHKRMLTKASIHFLFTEFECSILWCLNIAPSQLHSNSWSFVKSLKVVYEYFGIEPTIPQVFLFFTC